MRATLSISGSRQNRDGAPARSPAPGRSARNTNAGGHRARIWWPPPPPGYSAGSTDRRTRVSDQAHSGTPVGYADSERPTTPGRRTHGEYRRRRHRDHRRGRPAAVGGGGDRLRRAVADRPGGAARQGDADRHHDQTAARRGAGGPAGRGQPHPAARDPRHQHRRTRGGPGSGAAGGARSAHAALRRERHAVGRRAADRVGPPGRLAGGAVPRHSDRAVRPADGGTRPAGEDAAGCAAAGRPPRAAGHARAYRHRAVPVNEPRIETRDAWVEFPIFDAKSRSLKKAFLGKAGGAIGRNGSNVVVIEALRDITMSLQMGDRVGLVGHNGAGKSTLLRLLSGIYEPTRGAARIRGRVAPVFDLGVGMDPEISGYENIIIRGLFLGQTRKQMKAKVEEIADFTELGEYLDMPLRTYSTGMRVRLAMGVVTSIDPEILLLDEGIGAVDAEFMKKARIRLRRLVSRAGILVFASHSNEFLAQLCTSAMWIDHGEIKLRGSIEEVVGAYEGPDAAAHVRRVIAETERE